MVEPAFRYRPHRLDCLSLPHTNSPLEYRLSCCVRRLFRYLAPSYLAHQKEVFPF